MKVKVFPDDTDSYERFPNDPEEDEFEKSQRYSRRAARHNYKKFISEHW